MTEQGDTMRAGLILLVEDNLDDELLTKRALKQANFRSNLHVVRDGAEALDWLSGRVKNAEFDPKDVSLVLLDLKLPKVDGLEVLRGIRAHGVLEHVPVVVLTSSREEEDLRKSYELGANSCVRKPVDFRRFADTVKQLGLYWLALNEPVK
jgi:two-component system response regulator